MTLEVDWDAYRRCSVCGAQTGFACRSLSGTIVNGRPDGVRSSLAWVHAGRVQRKRR